MGKAEVQKGQAGSNNHWYCPVCPISNPSYLMSVACSMVELGIFGHTLHIKSSIPRAIHSINIGPAAGFFILESFISQYLLSVSISSGIQKPFA